MTGPHSYAPRQAYIATEGWGGYNEQAVLLVGETPQKYRIRAVMRTKLGGRGRWLNAGEETLVPKYAVRLHATSRNPE